MPRFSYSIQSQEGKQYGLLEGASRIDIEKILRSKNAIILSIEELENSDSLQEHYPSIQEKLWVTLAQQELFLEQMSAMLTGGVPIITAIETLAHNSSKNLRGHLLRATARLSSGESLRTIFSEELTFLGPVVLGLIQAGEMNGQIDKMCSYSAKLIAQQRELRSKVLQALMYPIIVIMVLIGVVCFLVYGVFPKLIVFLDAKSAALPPITQLLFSIINFIQLYGIYIFITPILLSVLIIFLRKNVHFGWRIDGFFIKVPLLGKVMKSASNSLISNVLGILLKSGINIIDALECVFKTTHNYYYQKVIFETKELILIGNTFSQGMKKSRLTELIPLAESMVIVGENTGRLDESLLLVARFSEDDLSRRINFLSKMIEPVLFLIVGSIVGFVYIAFFMALMSVSQGASQ